MSEKSIHQKNFPGGAGNSSMRFIAHCQRSTESKKKRRRQQKVVQEIQRLCQARHSSNTTRITLAIEKVLILRKRPKSGKNLRITILKHGGRVTITASCSVVLRC